MRGVLAALGVAAATAVGQAHAQEAVSDPFEDVNRGMFAAHEAVDRTVLEPVARGYRAATPRPVRSGVSNFLRNLRSPVIFANDVLQGEADRASTTFMRFGINTTVGVLGFFDPATNFGFERHDEDFGQTLAVWGVDAGPYIFVPVLGPTTVRDGFGRVVDMAFDPLTWAEFDGDDAARTTRTVVTGVAARESMIEAIEDLHRDSLDPYVSIRTSYGLLRSSAIENGGSDVQDLPEFEEVPSLEPAPPAPETIPEVAPSPDVLPESGPPPGPVAGSPAY